MMPEAPPYAAGIDTFCLPMKILLCAALMVVMVEPEILLATNTAPATATANVSLPADYATWRHVKTQIIQEGPGFERFGGMHHIYANERAVRGLRSGRFEDGAILVAEFRDLERKGNIINGGAIRLVDVMRFDARQFATTDGWGYAEFTGPTLQARSFDSNSECHACHRKRADKGHVFSELPK